MMMRLQKTSPAECGISSKVGSLDIKADTLEDFFMHLCDINNL